MVACDSGDAVMVVLFYLFLYGAPSLLAAMPGLVALGNRRKILGTVLLVGAVIVIAVPVYLEQLGLKAAVARGELRDDIAFLFIPWFFGVVYALAASIVLGAVVILGRLRR